MYTLATTLNRYRTIELVTASLLALLLVRFDLSLQLGVRAALCILFVLIAAIDLQERRIPNVLVLALGVLALAPGILQPAELPRILLGGAFAFAPFALTAFLRPAQLGGGDIKLAAAMGLLFGFPNIIWILLVSVFAGGAIAVNLFLTHQGTRRTEIAYGPFLCLGALIGLFVF